jgi:hypothetical protein
MIVIEEMNHADEEMINANENAYWKVCMCDKSSPFCYALTRFVVGFDQSNKYACECCNISIDKYNVDEFELPTDEDIQNLFKADKVNNLNARIGKDNLNVFDSIKDMIEILLYEEDMPYLKYVMHCNIQYRIQRLDDISKILEALVEDNN